MVGPIYPSYLLGYLLAHGRHKGPPIFYYPWFWVKRFKKKTLIVKRKETRRDIKVKKLNNLRRDKI